MTPEQMAEIVARAIETSVAPVMARLAVAEAQIAAYDVASDRKQVADLRERVAIHETRTEPLLTKVAELDARPWATKQLWESLETTVVDLRAKLATLEARAAVPGPSGPQGPPGPSGPQGTPGERGADGAAGKDGAPGPQGAKGVDGAAGKDGATGAHGKDGAVGPAGQKGLDGAPGLGIAGALLARDGDLVLTFTDGSSKSVGIVAGKDGAPGLAGKDADTAAILTTLSEEIAAWPRPQNGKDGRDGADGQDGLGFDDLSVLFDEAKGYRLRFKRGDLEREHALAVPFHAGLWQAGRSYVAGANVTAKGSTWIAQSETHGARPGEDTPESRVWRLAVKRGADGKPGKDGRNGEGDE